MQAASRCGQEQLHGEVHEDCLKRLCAIQQLKRRDPLFCYWSTPAGCSLFGAASPLRSVSLKTNWPLGLNGMKRDVLDGRHSSTSRASASNRTIKISASIATTFGSKRPNSDVQTVYLSLLKTVIGSTALRGRVTAISTPARRIPERLSNR